MWLAVVIILIGSQSKSAIYRSMCFPLNKVFDVLQPFLEIFLTTWMSLIWQKGHQNPRRERLAWVKCESFFFFFFFILGLNVLCYQTTTWSGFCERACKLISFFFFLFSGSQRYNGTQNSRKPIPLSMRIDQQISPASSSSSSSGLIADIDINTKRPGRESELEVAVQKLKDMSITETKGEKNWATLSANALVLLFIRSVIGAENSHHTLNQSKVK